MPKSTLKDDLGSASLIALVYALRTFGFMAVLPVLAIYATEYSHATPLTTGLVIGSYGLTQAIFQLILGRLSDRIGRKPVVYLGLFLLILGSVLAWSTTDFYVLIVARSIQGAGAIGSTLSAWCADLTSAKHRTKCMALIGGGIGLSFTLAIVLAPTLTAHYGLAGLFLLTAFFGGLAALLITKLPNTKPKTIVNLSPKRVRALVTSPALSRLLVGIMILHALYAACFMFIPKMMTMAWHLPHQNLWQIYLPLLVLCYLLAFPAIAWAEKQHQLRKLVQIGQGLLLLSLMAFAWHLPHAYTLALGLGLLWLGFTMLEALLPSLTSQHAPSAHKGLVMGLFSTAQYIGLFVGGSGAGALYGHFGWYGILIASFIALALWAWHQYSFPKSLWFQLHTPLSSSIKKTLLSKPGVLNILPSRQEESFQLIIHPRHCDRKKIRALLAPFTQRTT